MSVIKTNVLLRVAPPALSAECPEQRGNGTRYPSGNWQIHPEWKMRKIHLEFRGEINPLPPGLPPWLFPVLPGASKCEWAGITAACLGGSKDPLMLSGIKESWGSSTSLGINTFKWGIKASLSRQYWCCTYFQPYFTDLFKLLLQLRAWIGELQTKEKQLQDCHFIYIYH